MPEELKGLLKINTLAGRQWIQPGHRRTIMEIEQERQTNVDIDTGQCARQVR